MEGMHALGVFAFIVSLVLMSRVKRLERILRENNIRSGGAGPLNDQLRNQIGETVNITLYEGGGSTTTPCRVLDVDEEWVHILRNEGKKNQREMLIRLGDIKQIKGSA